MTTTSRKCANPDCTVCITDGHLLCRACWMELPKGTQFAVQERIHGWKNNDEARNYLAGHYRAEARKATESRCLCVRIPGNSVNGRCPIHGEAAFPTHAGSMEA